MDILKKLEKGERVDNTSLKRPVTSFSDDSQRFILPKGHTFTNQYSHLYFTRLCKLKPIIRRVAEETYQGLSDKSIINELCNIPDNVDCIIIGTIVKDTTLKPSALQYVCATEMYEEEENANYTSDKDFLVLEDPTGRIKLSGNINPHEFFTGIIIGLKGKSLSNISFEVEEIIYPSLPSLPSIKPSSEPEYLAVISNLRLHPLIDIDHASPLQLLRDFLSGSIGSAQDKLLSSQISRLLILGSTIDTPTPTPLLSHLYDIKTKQEKQKELEDEDQMLSNADSYLSSLALLLPVDLVPGEKDFANVLLPQQPIHPFLLPLSRQHQSFCSRTNPFSFTCGGQSVLAATQTLDSALSFVNPQEVPANVVQTLALTRHIAPTCPSALGCYPLTENDPFVIEENENGRCPSLLICSYSNRAEASTWKRLKDGDNSSPLCVAVSPFYLTAELLLINLSTLEIQSISFKK